MQGFLRATLSFGAVYSVLGTVSLPRVFSDGVVLQTRVQYGQRSFIYGTAAPAEIVSLNVSFGDAITQYNAQADAAGDWIVQLNPENDGPAVATITVSGSSDAYTKVITIRNVAFGDVYLCSGQSNMDFSLTAAFGGDAIAANSYPNIRLFPVAEGGALEPQNDVPEYINASATPCWWWQTGPPNASSPYACNRWQVAEPGITQYFSAVCFLTALELSRVYTENRTIGLVFASVGGTAISNWMPPEAYSACSNASSTAVAGHRLAGSPPVLECPSCLYNAMINPFSQFALRSFLW
jgi:sialate O-acetylesterase